MPSRTLADTSLTALDHRVLGCVSMHDGMSLLKGKGGGCYASNQRMAREVDCNYSALCKSVTKLVDRGYLVRERRGGRGGLSVLQVDFEGADTGPVSWRDGQHSNPEIVGKMANNPAPLVGEATTENAPLVGRADSEARRNLPKTDHHYTPLRGELDSVETGEIDSAKQRDLENRGVPDAVSALTDGAQLARLERALKTDPASINLEAWLPWLEDLQDQSETTSPEYNQAVRLAEKVQWQIDLWAFEHQPLPATSSRAAASNGLGRDALAAAIDADTDAARVALKTALLALRRAKGNVGISHAAKAASVPTRRVQAFINGADLLEGPSIMRLLARVSANGRAVA
jgi:hypothetical protein